MVAVANAGAPYQFVSHWTETLIHFSVAPDPFLPWLGVPVLGLLWVRAEPLPKVSRVIAVVRRIMKPGCKFDQVLLLQGAQGAGKSTAIRTLAMEDEWFTDNLSISPKSQEVIEQTSGKLIVEVPELSGMRMADKDHVKAFLSRTVDIARPAYGRVAVERPRQFMILSSGGDVHPVI